MKVPEGEMRSLWVDPSHSQTNVLVVGGGLYLIHLLCPVIPSLSSLTAHPQKYGNVLQSRLLQSTDDGTSVTPYCSASAPAPTPTPMR